MVLVDMPEALMSFHTVTCLSLSALAAISVTNAEFPTRLLVLKSLWSAANQLAGREGGADI